MRVIRLGRAEDNDFVVNHPMISGYHADIYVFDNGAIQYMDHSTNGTEINGHLIINASCQLTDGDKLVLPGNISLDVSTVIATSAKIDTSKYDDMYADIPVTAESTPKLAVDVNSFHSKSSCGNTEPRPAMFSKMFSFRGRIRRLEYNIVNFSVSIISSILSLTLDSIDETVGLIIILLMFVPLLWVQYAEGAKRCHDLGHSGWFQLIPFYPLVMIFCSGERGENEYGVNPKGE